MAELHIEADIKNLSRVLSFIETQMEGVACSPKALIQLNIAVEEVFVNIAHYAYAPGTGSADIRLEIDGEPPEVIVTFTDSGRPYNPLQKEDPDVTLSAEERGIGGLGIFMVKKSMDSIRYAYENGKNILTLVKRL